APKDFDARFAASWRRYTYRVADARAERNPLRRTHVLWHRAALDEQAMNVAAEALCGEHDFLAYCKPREGATTIRTLQHFAWRRSPEEGGVLVAQVRADAFCHAMVRSLVGACLAVGQGQRDVGWPSTVLAARRRDSAVQVAPAHGLTLEEVGYPPAEQLAQRVAAARNMRGPLP
ncbi:MAG TPA: tRNA pseudouridine synthase A, partial [Actinomycetaceae bacterium]|nr:tRNA pseudouridine synthase A [Actinomycetaceae bacterium]